MTSDATISLTTNIADVPGVGPRHAEAYRRLGIRCVADLLQHLPMRYEQEHGELSIAAAGAAVGAEHRAEAFVATRGEVASVRQAGAPRGRRPRIEATLQDETGTMLLTWFNAPWMRGKLHPGMTIRVWGKIKRWGDYLQMVNAKWAPDDPDTPAPGRSARHRPVYPASEALSSETIERAVGAILEPALAQLDDHLPEDERDRLAVPTLSTAYRMAHRPVDADAVKAGRRRLALDELLILQLAVMMKRHHRRAALRAPALRHGQAIDEHITARFPFELTASQRQVIDEIASDLCQDRPMNRLLQGDVGAGKTVVALYAMLMAVASGHQAALMGPTELLAEQHGASIRELLRGSKVSLEILTGSLPAARRAEVIRGLETGEVDLVIGTHALLTESVSFKSLAVAVIDEQHRFGVHQRATLRSKAGAPNTVPHTLVMTATPIPRTLSLTVFGDLDVSTIRGMPPGRQPILTRHVSSAQSSEVYRYVATRLAAGEQAYIVVPVIDESDLGLADVQSHLERLETGPLRSFRLAAMHGRLRRDEREAVMEQFRSGQIDALVATTVIEVGIDVSNAVLMVIEHADRFGLAQLHQLRGRIGRGDKKSLCVLIADPVTDDGRARVEAIASTSDGFQIAERDLAIRGPGELFGARQSGLAPLRVARIPDDLELLALARREARRLIEQDPVLGGPQWALLRKRVLKAHGKALGLGDVA